MCRVAKRVQEGGDLRGDAGMDVPGVGGREGEVLGKTAVPVDADADRVRAQVPAARPAAPADAAEDVPFTRDALPDLVPVRSPPCDDPADELVADRRAGLMVRCDHSSQFQIWRSVPQMAAFATRTRRSFPPISGIGTSCISRPAPAVFFTRAFMAVTRICG